MAAAAVAASAAARSKTLLFLILPVWIRHRSFNFIRARYYNVTRDIQSREDNIIIILLLYNDSRQHYRFASLLHPPGERAVVPSRLYSYTRKLVFCARGRRSFAGKRNYDHGHLRRAVRTLDRRLEIIMFFRFGFLKKQIFPIRFRKFRICLGYDTRSP